LHGLHHPLKPRLQGNVFRGNSGNPTLISVFRFLPVCRWTPLGSLFAVGPPWGPCSPLDPFGVPVPSKEPFGPATPFPPPPAFARRSPEGGGGFPNSPLASLASFAVNPRPDKALRVPHSHPSPPRRVNLTVGASKAAPSLSPSVPGRQTLFLCQMRDFPAQNDLRASAGSYAHKGMHMAWMEKVRNRA